MLVSIVTEAVEVLLLPDTYLLTRLGHIYFCLVKTS
jgi:hypothetical protein